MKKTQNIETKQKFKMQTILFFSLERKFTCSRQNMIQFIELKYSQVLNTDMVEKNQNSSGKRA